MKDQGAPPRARPRIYRERDVVEMLGTSASWLDREVAEKRFPAPIKLSPADTGRAKGWLANEVDDWLAARIAERDRAA